MWSGTPNRINLGTKTRLPVDPTNTDRWDVPSIGCHDVTISLITRANDCRQCQHPRTSTSLSDSLFRISRGPIPTSAFAGLPLSAMIKTRTLRARMKKTERINRKRRRPSVTAARPVSATSPPTSILSTNGLSPLLATGSLFLSLTCTMFATRTTLACTLSMTT